MKKLVHLQKTFSVVQHFTILTVFAILLSLTTIFAQVVGAEGTKNTTTTKYDPVEIHTGFNLQATLNQDGHVEMKWNAFAPTGFKWLKVIRSDNNSNPTYPEVSGLHFSEDKTFNSYVDKAPFAPHGYYRVCAIAPPKRYCSNVVKVAKAAAAKPANPTKTDSKTDTKPATKVKIELKGKVVNGKIELIWHTDSDAIKHGFKVLRSSENPFPIYPAKTDKGEKSSYISKSETRLHYDKSFDPKTKYYYRLCQYDGNGGCLAYSNSITVDPSSTTVTNTPIKTTTKKATKEKTTTKVIAQPIAVSPKITKPKTRAKKVKEHIVKEVKPFSDTQENPFFNSIEYVQKRSIVAGYKDGSYRPNKTINRAEFTKIIIAAEFDQAAIDDCQVKKKFTDVSESEWFAPYVCLAYNNGFIKGYDNNTFRPNSKINFAEAAKILSLVYDIPLGKETKDWYVRYILPLQNKNYIPPSVSTFDKQITRGEVAELIWRIREQEQTQSSRKILKVDSVTVPATSKTVDDKETTTKEKTKEKTNTVSTNIDDWKTLTNGDYSIAYPATWFQGVKHNKVYISEEEDYITNLQTPGNFDVKTYVTTYKVAADRSASIVDSLKIGNRFDHELKASKTMNINGVPALRRDFFAAEGTEVNGRTTQIDENIVQYTYRSGDIIYVMQYFTAYSVPEYNYDIFEKMAKSFKLNKKSS